jgi:hypothetical protein
VVNSSWPFSFFLFATQVKVFLGTFFSLTPHPCPGLTCLHLDYLLMHPGLLPPPPTHPPIYLSTHSFAYLPINLPTYVLTH